MLAATLGFVVLAVELPFVSGEINLEVTREGGTGFGCLKMRWRTSRTLSNASAPNVCAHHADGERSSRSTGVCLQQSAACPVPASISQLAAPCGWLCKTATRRDNGAWPNARRSRQRSNGTHSSNEPEVTLKTAPTNQKEFHEHHKHGWWSWQLTID